MVDIRDENEDERERLRRRAESLTHELDGIESSYKECATVFRNVILAICEFGHFELNPEASEAIDDFAAAFQGGKIDVERIGGALITLRTALLNRPVDKSTRPGGGGDGGGGIGSHVAMGIMTGLHLNEPEFDRYLEATMTEVAGHIKNQTVKPAIALAEELLARHRETLDRRRQNAVKAMREVLAELVHTEDELAEAFQLAASRLRAEGQKHEASVNASMGHLARQVTSNENLDNLKTSVLGHIRFLRSEIKNKRQSEQELLSSTQDELDRLKVTLGATRVRMEHMEKQSERLSLEAYTDPLTKVWNKRALNQRLDDAISLPAARPLSLIVFDIDHFKDINDNFGHQAGDMALKTIAKQAQTALRKKVDALFRYAGDEFVVLLTNTGLEDAKVIGDRIRTGVANIKFTYHGMNEQRVTISLGVAEAVDEDTPALLFGRADAALLEAKHSGRNQLLTA
jgi:diguanylate cyclase